MKKSSLAHARMKAHQPLAQFSMKPLAVLIAMYCSGAMAAGANDAAPNDAATSDGSPEQTALQEIVVTGLRQSLITSETIKRDSPGVVDAITAEDIGKFPDTNLAESIQRIPGVTIDRMNNEGSRVTVRGFGPDFNMVLLNGRSMPGSVIPGVNATRAFDFENISADGIAGITVYKTGRADVPSGGIGATINIITARPFDYKEMRATFQAKATDDTSTKVGAKVTPEFSGLFSDTFFDNRVGVLLNGSYSKRNSQEQLANIDGWLEDQFAPGDPRITSSNTNPGGHNWAPRNEGWGVVDHERTRVNGQAVLQFKPVDSLVATADYTYTYYKDIVNRHTFGAWFDYGPNPTSATINSHGTVTNLVDTGSDLSYFAASDDFLNQNGSGGLNVKWQATDNIAIEFDGHHSFANSGGGAYGNNNFGIIGQNPQLSLNKYFSLGSGTIPITSWTYKPPYNTSNLGTSTIDPLFGQANNNVFKTVIDEVQLFANWKNSSQSGLTGIKAGIDLKRMTTEAESFNSGNFPWGYYNPAYVGLIPASAFTKVSSCSILKSFSGGGCGIAVPYFYSFPLQAAIAATQPGGAPGDGNFPPYTFAQAKTPTNDDHIRENTPAPFVQMDFDTEFDGMRLRALAGLRYEHSTVTARSLQKVPTSISWVNPTEFTTQYAANATYSDVGSSYSEFLPSLDTSLQVLPDVLLRASYSKTITRSDLTSMIGTTSVTNAPKPGSRTATAGNPGLLPYESNNFDLAAEWYYAKGSYVSANWFVKNVTNFLTQTTTQRPLFGITDPNAGAIAKQAIAELQAAGKAVSAQTIFAQMLTDHPGQLTFPGQAGDPLVIWDITAPSNANRTQLHGFEFSVQQLFGDSGFGIQANWSLPSGGAQFNSLTLGSQFALPGLSRSYNVVGFFEKWGFQTRVAYSHRGAFLAGVGQVQQANEPVYTAPYGQLDMSASYDFNKHLGVFFDAINLTSASQRQYARYREQFYSASEGFARYQVGVRLSL
ncbi:MAG: TonB-dependent receptor [Pseudomonadota bacterium]|nr:TonB-dependent receptor [Pseudomonadota bacterium]